MYIIEMVRKIKKLLKSILRDRLILIERKTTSSIIFENKKF
jgi:hypothetical protein